MPRQQPPSDELFTRATELSATGVTGDAVADCRTGAAHGIDGGTSGTRTDLLMWEIVADVRAHHSHIDRCRVAEDFANNWMNALEPKGRPRGRFAPQRADDRTARRKKKSRVFP